MQRPARRHQRGNRGQDDGCDQTHSAVPVPAALTLPVPTNQAWNFKIFTIKLIGQKVVELQGRVQPMVFGHSRHPDLCFLTDVAEQVFATFIRNV